MAARPAAPNRLRPEGRTASLTLGDVPERLRQRYYLERGPREWRFYDDAQVKVAAFQDRGRRLVSARGDPNAVRDMMAVAAHRDWRVVEARGAPAFRREAWLAGGVLGLEVRGYAPTERDLQELERRRAGRAQLAARLGELERGVAAGGSHRGGPADRLRTVETVVRARVVDPLAQDRLLARARTRIADWLERGAQFQPLGRPAADRGRQPGEGRERRHSR
ncbi:LPD7 domain-containing protein [Phenylobacterium sp.]|jgi:hypothetical protein|uniref:LPD7 domain-containing protein n=1 Tax=Phenylobacterium sp. TaxID=1871053 RepID=UPI002F3F7A03